MSTSNSTTSDPKSTASASNVVDRDRDVFKLPSPARNKNPTSSGNGKLTVASHTFVTITRFLHASLIVATYGFSQVASPSGEKSFEKKNDSRSYASLAFTLEWGTYCRPFHIV
jgi:hypothetical protein